MNKKITKHLLSYLTQEQRQIVFSSFDNCFGLEYSETDNNCKYCSDNVNCSVMFNNSEYEGLSEFIYKLLDIQSIPELSTEITIKILTLIQNLQNGKPMTESELKEVITIKMNLNNKYIIDYFTDKFIIENKIKVKSNNLYYEK